MPITQLPDPKDRIGTPGNLGALTNALVSWLKLCQQQLNRLSSGSISASTTATTAPPPPKSVTMYAQGDFIRNSNPTVLGTAGSRYVLIGWVCVAGGTPGTWVESRTLTGT